MIYIGIPFIFLVSIIFFLECKHQKSKSLQNQNFIQEQINIFEKAFQSLNNHYITQSESSNFIRFSEEILHKLKKTHISKKDKIYPEYVDIKQKLKSIQTIIENLNKSFINKKSIEYDSFLSDIDGKSLDIQQREAVICDEKNILVIAGAGSGKTLTIAGKVKYLCELQNVLPEDILLISFTNKAAEEMTERIKNKLNINVTSTTFHKLGLDIIIYSQNFRPNVYDDLSIFIHNFFEKEIVNHPELTKNLIEYFAYYLELPEEIDESKSLGEIYEKEKSADLETLKSKYEKANYIKNIDNEKKVERITLKGEHVKSIEETKIANFFFLNGINYEYEKDYPYKNDDLNYKIYQPDFYLTDYDIYLEHFGIDENGKLPWLSEVEEKKYLDGIEWKREFHKKNGTKLIETYSYYCSKGILQEKVIALMKENNISLKQPDFLDIFDKIYASKSEKYFNEFIKLCSTFITLFKSNNYDLNTITLLQKEVYQNQKRIKAERNLLFLEIIKIILEKYNSFLENNNLIDFSDMINLATKNVNNGFILHKYKYVIVDEFQDISNSRFLLLKSIVDSTDAKLFCVGDDWQSIYRFAGSDISLFTQFEKYFGYTKILKIEKTYRNSQELIDVASDFISRNPFQLNKELVSDKHLKFPLVFWAYTDFSQTLEKILNKIILDFGTESSILLLGRTNFDISLLKESGLFTIQKEKIIYKKSPDTPILFFTVHKSKGLEADNVVLINFKNEKLGFPNQIADDDVLKLVLKENEDYIFSEERRLFYVAITRTKNRTFILTDANKPSIFFKDFEEYKNQITDKVCFIAFSKKTEEENCVYCPRCKSGLLYKVNSNGKTFIGCNNFPFCNYTVKDTSVLVNPVKCPECGGFLIKRKNKNSKHWFIGCTNYPFCEYTEKIKW